jgi:hypothetical protein
VRSVLPFVLCLLVLLPCCSNLQERVNNGIVVDANIVTGVTMQDTYEVIVWGTDGRTGKFERYDYTVNKTIFDRCPKGSRWPDCKKDPSP